MHLLEIKNLNYSVDGNTILKNINLSVNSGDFLTIVGPSGAGKSTLLKIIASLLTPTSGSIEYDGKDISQYSPLEYRRQVSYCFQQVLWLPHPIVKFVVKRLNFELRQLVAFLHQIKN